jgi:hypothetical protein
VYVPGRCFAVGSKDMSTWVFGAERWANLIYYSLGGHKDLVVGCFFEKESLDVRRPQPHQLSFCDGFWHVLDCLYPVLAKRPAVRRDDVAQKFYLLQ